MLPSAEKPPKTTHFGRPLELAKVHWVRPELVAEVAFQTWTADKVLRHVSYIGRRRPSAVNGHSRDRDRAARQTPYRAWYWGIPIGTGRDWASASQGGPRRTARRAGRHCNWKRSFKKALTSSWDLFAAAS